MLQHSDRPIVAVDGFRPTARISLVLAAVGAVAVIAALFLPPNNALRMTAFALAYIGGLTFLAAGYSYASLFWRFHFAVHLLAFVPPILLAFIYAAIHLLGPDGIGVIIVMVHVASWIIFMLFSFLMLVALAGWVAYWRHPHVRLRPTKSIVDRTAAK